ncbi:hypothetical protein CRENBAI_005594 [Crenichthys baileyi]|uniref:Uncharacterized protein n=1 Tax=Crenichthys baileyi TaxID=28760 RepID=A0AAV9S836_9TELE
MLCMGCRVLDPFLLHSLIASVSLVLQIPPGAPAHMCRELIESLIASTLSLLRSACQARSDESALREGEAGGPRHAEPLLSPEEALNWRTDGI